MTTRRALLALAATLLPAAAPVRPTRLTVAGPADGALAQPAAALIEALRNGGEAIAVETVGTADGATGANRFTASAVADGSDLLMLPGEALQAWLAGDPRARYEPARWIPLAAAVQPVAKYQRLVDPDPALRAAEQAMRNATQIVWLLVLPPLTGAQAAAAWRHRTGIALDHLRARDTSRAQDTATRLLDAPEAAEVLAATVPDEASLLAYRGSRSRRLNPG